jgi:hypothetical protein
MLLEAFDLFSMKINVICDENENNNKLDFSRRKLNEKEE